LFLGDQSNYGLLKSSYVSSSISYHLNLNENNTIGVGFQSTVGKRYLDRVNLTFGNQFGSNGFDVNRASGENQLLKMPVFYSLNAGVQYSYQTTYNQFNMGISLFNMNKPQQSFLKDISQRASLETVFYSSYEFSSWNNLLFSANGIFRIQAKQNYFAFGGVVGLDMSKGENIQVLYAGSWFREGDAIYPYVGIMLNNLQIGLSYDIVISKQNLGNINPQSIELSFIWRDLTNQSGKIICPWR
jgi:type IX secretion system PorP/SprF family membrane protein